MGKILTISHGLIFVQRHFWWSFFFFGGGGDLLLEGTLHNFASESAAPEEMWLQSGGIKLPVVHFLQFSD